ncbi:CHRD domain-containing protein, partial [Nesterenkonia aurantiaca]|uniref:CHRD domain-containing protein n=1 Tax=Nesterenkonia aurantiaca TaxID=1436010 RepID=UPI003EE58F85
GAAGESGPPRIAFPDPEPIGDEPRTSSGCMAGPFMTGVEGDDGADTGEGFSLAEIEADPAGYYADPHTEEFVPGVVRGQLMQVPLDGVETGGGGMQQSSTQIGVFAGAGVLALAGASAFMLMRRNQAA